LVGTPFLVETPCNRIASAYFINFNRYWVRFHLDIRMDG
jgi:hypothetical protein